MRRISCAFRILDGTKCKQDALTSCGYAVLTKSPEAGVDLFVKKKHRSLFVHFQGHPEYGAQTLLKEYRRDIKRFLRQERDMYPSMPSGYFGPTATRLLNSFRDDAMSDRTERIMEFFPETAVAGGLQNTWQASATCLYRNWLQYVASKKIETSPLGMARVGRVRSALVNGDIA